MKPAKNNYSKLYLMLILISTIGFSQEVKERQETAIPKNTNQIETYLQLIVKEISKIELPFLRKESISNVLKTKHDTAKNSVGNIR